MRAIRRHPLSAITLSFLASLVLAGLAGLAYAAPSAAASKQRGRRIPSAWQACASDRECVVIEHQCCAHTAVSRRHQANARARLPVSTCDMVCEPAPAPRCRERRCVLGAPRGP